MCEVKVYLNEKQEENKLDYNVSSYDLDIKGKRLTTYKLFSKPKEFKFECIEQIRWSESDDSLIIRGKLDSILENS
ncbi:hypothetical protein HZA33_04900 [Candidatus Pacearchaeota archaeon]|nr:hypothetical protein [Candidatus Pacearchaeota archaeon]